MILAPLWLFWHCMGWFGLVWAARMGRNILHGLAWWTRGAIKTYNLRKSYSFWTKNLGAYWSLRATQKWCVIFLIWQWMEDTLYIFEQQALNTCCLLAKPVKTSFWAVWAEKHVLYSWYMPQTSQWEKETNVPVYKRNLELSVLAYILWWKREGSWASSSQENCILIST